MRSLTRGIWRVGVPLAGLLFLLLLLVLVPLSTDAHTGTPGLATPVTPQVTPTIDLTVTALAKEQLALQVKQLQGQTENQNNWLANNSTALIAAAATVIVALFGILQWAITVRQAQDKELRDRADARVKERVAQEKESRDRQEAQDRELRDRQATHDKDLRDRAEERFKTAITALGSDNEATQVGGAILLRSFLNEEDTNLYGRYYALIFDLAAAYLRLLSKFQPQDSDTPLQLSPLRLALIAIFREAFPLARDWSNEQNPKTPFNPQFLDASHVKLDNAYFSLADLEQVWMPQAFLREANLNYAEFSCAMLRQTDFRGSTLIHTNFSPANLVQAQFNHTELYYTHLNEAHLMEANLSLADLVGTDLNGADISKADFSGASLVDVNLSGANLKEAIFSGATLLRTNIEKASSLEGTDLRGVKGLTREQLLACKAKGAIVDEETLAKAPQATVTPLVPSQSSDVQASLAPSAQAKTAPASTDGSTSASSEPSTQP